MRIMKARSGGRCEGCGKVDRVEAHHRLYRSRGGLGGAGNGALLCGFGNSSGCHGKAHSAAGEGLGWSVRRGFDAEQIPMIHARFGVVLLTDSGLVLAADGSACWAHHAEYPDGVIGCRACVPKGRVLWEFEEEKGWI